MNAFAAENVPKSHQTNLLKQLTFTWHWVSNWAYKF